MSGQGATADFSGWRVTGAAFVVAVFGWGVGFYGPPVFLHAVHEERGWSVALVSAAVTCHFLLGAAVVANLPALHRRFGLVVAMLAGAGAAVAAWTLELFTSGNLAKGAEFLGIYLGCLVVSGALLAGLVGWLLTRALAATGVLDRFASGRSRAR